MQAASLLAKNQRPTDTDIDEVMRGNICRCGTYQDIRAAIHRAVALKRAANGAKPAAVAAATAAQGGVA
jgi:aerobic-type carbon monoxide dehydrogenase small subunit (CoxS/CutS family)